MATVIIFRWVGGLTDCGWVTIIVGEWNGTVQVAVVVAVAAVGGGGCGDGGGGSTHFCLTHMPWVFLCPIRHLLPLII